MRFSHVNVSFIYFKKIGFFEKSNVLATNIYDITKHPIDSSTYFKTAFENSFPIILQASLNAIGQSEMQTDGFRTLGYLKPQKGVTDFTNSICDIVVECLNNENGKSNYPPLFGVGLDHIDLKGDLPVGRSNRFVREANTFNYYSFNTRWLR